MADTDLVLVDRAGPLATVTINRPDKLNALNPRVLEALGVVFEALTKTSDDAEPVRAAILTGAGKAFVAGADISDMASITPSEGKRFSEIGQRLCASIELLPFPVIAAVNGYALGGGLELALACDFIIASENAKLGLPEVTLAVIPGFGGTQRLMRRVGIGKARELVFTADTLNAEQALGLGLVNAVFPAAELLLRARDIALKIASRGPLAIAAAKRVMLRGESLDLAAACELETQAFASLFGSEDQRSGMKAFLEKTKVAFSGK